MRPLVFLSCLIVFFAAVHCKHTFLGTNVLRPMLTNAVAKYDSKIFQKRVEKFHYSIPNTPAYFGKVIQGILAYDLTDSGASANVTEGGIGTQFVTLRMKSDRGKSLKYNIYIYA